MFFGLGLLGLIGTLTLGFKPGNAVFGLGLWTVFLITGVWRLIAVRRRRLEFEAKHGADAGRQ